MAIADNTDSIWYTKYFEQKNFFIKIFISRSQKDLFNSLEKNIAQIDFLAHETL